MRKVAPSRPQLVAALDIGSSKVSCVIAGRTEEGVLEILGMGAQASDGLKSGVIVQMEALESSILKAVHTAEEMVGETISEVVVNVNSPQLQSQILKTHVPIEGSSVTRSDVLQTTMHCKAHVVASGREIMHAIPIGYALDGVEGISDPVGMVGQELRARIHVMSVPAGVVQNLTTLVRRCHLDVMDVVVSPYAAALSTLVEDEKKLGVTLVDMGAGTTSFATFQDGHIVASGCIPVGGQHITQDIARGLSTPLRHAERLKTLYGSALQTASDDRETIVVPQIGDDQNTYAQSVPRAALIRIIRPRMEEILELVMGGALAGHGVQRIVLTGGGSQLAGLAEMVRQKTGLGVRTARPLAIQGMDDTVNTPAFSVSAGLLNFALAEQRPWGGSPSRMRGVMGRVSRWIQDHF